MTTRPLAVTLGDPAGVGPEIIVKAWTATRARANPFLVIGDADALRSSPGGLGVPVRIVAGPAEAPAVFAEAIPVLHLPLAAGVVAGQPSSDHAEAIIRWIETAVGLALTGGVAGVVTAPIAKAPLYAAGFPFPGHTEFLAELTAAARQDGPSGPVMMLAADAADQPGLRVCLATIHTPLSQVPAGLTIEGLVNAGLVVGRALRQDFGIIAPRLAVAGLNPHAGEQGGIGREEIDIIGPAVRALRDLGLDAVGPSPADTLFHPEARARHDAVLCMYHDQGLIPLKMLNFWGGVNVTLGLPIVRTSPDHGTGFDIAGRGVARPDSLINALAMARQIADRRAAA
ncbi:MAG: 4-hydroxythreonine-4-phosphate dehydrogenase PdxA [Caulobacter sp.]|nr:4-hydroxythreonine-4-phosphate dehydrogenase PdxA [Caulobacter sp.]